MGELTIKLEDASLLQKLQEMASSHGNSLEVEVQEVLEGAVAQYEDRLDLVKRAREIRAMTPKGVKQTDSVEIIRQMREERSRELGD
jgi:plasmid stability protein